MNTLGVVRQFFSSLSNKDSIINTFLFIYTLLKAVEILYKDNIYDVRSTYFNEAQNES